MKVFTKPLVFIEITVQPFWLFRKSEQETIKNEGNTV